MNQRQALRQQLRARRRSLTPRQQHLAGQQLARRFRSSLLFRRSRHIAVYLPNDGEIDPSATIALAWALGKACYLPVLHPFRRRTMTFVKYLPDTPMKPNRFGISEPSLKHRQLPAFLLQLVLMPLVGFDRSGGRLGMGGGFYDSTFAFKSQHKGRRPALIGLAHQCQEVSTLSLESWDIPIDGIFTDGFCITSIK